MRSRLPHRLLHCIKLSTAFSQLLGTLLLMVFSSILPNCGRGLGPPATELVLSVNSISVDENSSNSFTVQLGAEPTDQVKINLTSSDTSAFTFAPSSLTFNSENGSIPQTVTLTHVGIIHSDISASLTFSIDALNTFDRIGFLDVEDQSLSVTLNNLNYIHEAYLKAPETTDDDLFGWSVAISNDTIVVGAYFEDSNTTAIINGPLITTNNEAGLFNGAAYVFKRSGNTWVHEAYLKSPETTNLDIFGWSVAISNDIIVVGAYQEDSNTTAIINGPLITTNNEAGASNGAAYVFKRTGNIWAHEAYLKAPETTAGDNFGWSVAISDDTIVVGAAGEDSNTTAIINGDDLSANNDFGNANGAVYVFKRSGTTWVHEAYLKAPETTDDDFFGYSVAISNDTIVVGAYFEDSNTTAIINGPLITTNNEAGASNGAAYVFKRTGNIWAHEAYLKAPETTNFDNFGRSVSISNDTIVVGAHLEDSTTTAIINGPLITTNNEAGGDNGAAYVFKRSGTTWVHEAYLKAPETTDGDWFGISVAISDDTIVVGALFEDSTTTAIINGDDLSANNDLGNGNGAAYVFKRTGSTWAHEAYLKAPETTDGDWFGNSVAISDDTVVVGAYREDSTTTAIINGDDLSANNDLGNANGAAYIFRFAD